MSYTFKSKNGAEYTIHDELLYETPEPEKSKPDIFTIIAGHSGLVSANNIINSLNKENYKIVDTDTHDIVDKRQPSIPAKQWLVGSEMNNHFTIAGADGQIYSILGKLKNLS